MKKKPCKLIVNTSLGYTYPTIECSSIAEARRIGKEYPGFAYRIFVKEDDGIRVIHGYCD